MAQATKTAAASAAVLTAKIDQQGRTSRNMDSQIAAQLWQLWSGFTPQDWWNPDLVNGAAAKSVTLVTAALKQSRMAQRSFTTSVLRDLQALPRELPPLITDYPRSNVDPMDVYTRPAVQYQWQFSQGQPFQDARDFAKTRVDDVSQMDMLKARMDESKALTDASPEVIGRRRVIHPELSRSGTCGLCAVAATRFYKKSDLQPLHQHCECTEVPITRLSDPGLKLNQDDLNAIYGAAGGSTFPAELKDVRVTINEHGELGPLLNRKGDKFQGPKAVGAASFKKTPLTNAERIAAFNERLASLEPKLLAAQTNLANLPDEVRFGADGNTTADTVKLVQAVKDMSDYQRALTTQLAALKRAA